MRPPSCYSSQARGEKIGERSKAPKHSGVRCRHVQKVPASGHKCPGRVILAISSYPIFDETSFKILPDVGSSLESSRVGIGLRSFWASGLLTFIPTVECGLEEVERAQRALCRQMRVLNQTDDLDPLVGRIFPFTTHPGWHEIGFGGRSTNTHVITSRRLQHNSGRFRIEIQRRAVDAMKHLALDQQDMTLV